MEYRLWIIYPRVSAVNRRRLRLLRGSLCSLRRHLLFQRLSRPPHPPHCLYRHRENPPPRRNHIPDHIGTGTPPCSATYQRISYVSSSLRSRNGGGGSSRNAPSSSAPPASFPCLGRPLVAEKWVTRCRYWITKGCRWMALSRRSLKVAPNPRLEIHR